jgi:hypothetical protein
LTAATIGAKLGAAIGGGGERRRGRADRPPALVVRSAAPPGGRRCPGLQPNDRVVVRVGYARGVVGVVRAVYDWNGETLSRVDYEAFVFDEQHVYAGGDYPADGLEPAACAEA